MIASQKKALRAAALTRRAAIGPEAREKLAEKLALAGVDLARRAIARTVAAYWPMRDEADTRYLIEALLYHEFVVGLPAVEAPARPLLFRRWTTKDPLIPGPYGVREPSRRLPEVRPDILFVPLAAFDRRGNRLGYGGGYYDATLRELRAMKRVLAVGVAFAAQEAEAIPPEPHDERLDLVITESGLIECQPE